MIHTIEKNIVFDDLKSFGAQSEEFKSYALGIRSELTLVASESRAEGVGKNFRYTKAVYSNGVIKLIVDRIKYHYPITHNKSGKIKSQLIKVIKL